jgi:hypothetical protein
MMMPASSIWVEPPDTGNATMTPPDVISTALRLPSPFLMYALFVGRYADGIGLEPLRFVLLVKDAWDA